jgi:hypothetical protein
MYLACDETGQLVGEHSNSGNLDQETVRHRQLSRLLRSLDEIDGALQ